MPVSLKIKVGLILLLALFWSVYHEHYTGDFKRTIKIDGIGYNAYLPALFLHDGNLSWNYYKNTLDTMHLFEGKLQDFRKPYKGHYINKYPLGLAITQTPLWLSAWAYQGFNQKLNGYESPFQTAVFLNNILWLFAGIWLFSQVLFKQGWKENEIAIFNIMFLFGTNIFHFITFDNCLTHPVTIGLSLISIYLLDRFKREQKSIFWILFLLIFALLFCIRPVNLLLIPFFLIFYFLQNEESRIPRQIWMIIPAAAFALFLYLGSNKLQTGHWFVYTYQNEKFVWDEFHLSDVLWGYRCGVFLYTPVLLIAIFFWFKSNNKKLVMATFFAMFLSMYIISCWNEYCYGCRLGNRPLTDYYIFFALPLLNINWEMKMPSKIILICVLLFCLYYNQILHYQYRHYLLDWCNVQGRDFWHVFLQTDRN